MRCTVPTDADGFPIDTAALLFAREWMSVLARPQDYRALQRPVDAAVKAALLCLIEVWIAYVARGDCYFDDPTEEDHPALARKLRGLLEAWTPPDLPAEITEAARAVLDARGEKQWRLETGRTWDDVRVDDRPVDTYLLWPEGLAEVWPKRGATDEERAEREALRRVQLQKWLALPEVKAARERTSERAERVYAAMDVAKILASPRVVRRMKELPSRQQFLERWDGLQSVIDHAASGCWDARSMLALEPHLHKLRALCESWTPSADVPSEIQRAARDLLAAFDIPEPPEGWDRWEGAPEDGP